MNDFLKKVKDGLDLFMDKVQEEEIDSLKTEIEKKVASGMTEEEAVKEMGSVQSQIKKIFEKHGINSQKIVVKKNFFYSKLEELFETIHHVVDVMSKNTWKENAKIILDIVMLILIVCLIKVPFIFIRNIGDNLLQFMESPVVQAIWGIAIDFAYIIVALMVFINIFTKWFKNLKGEKEPIQKSAKEIPKIKGNALEGITLNQEEKKSEKKES